jgi:hypothetical protein
MNDLILKIESTVDVVVPFLVLVFSALQMSGVVTIIDTAVPIIYGALALTQAVFKIWGFGIRRFSVPY